MCAMPHFSLLSAAVEGREDPPIGPPSRLGPARPFRAGSSAFLASGASVTSSAGAVSALGLGAFGSAAFSFGCFVFFGSGSFFASDFFGIFNHQFLQALGPALRASTDCSFLVASAAFLLGRGFFLFFLFLFEFGFFLKWF